MFELAREYARVAFTAAAGDPTTEALMTERAAEIEDLCVIVHAALSGQTLVRPGDILVTERLGVLSAAHALSRGVSAIVADGPLPEDGAVAALAPRRGRAGRGRLRRLRVGAPRRSARRRRGRRCGQRAREPRGDAGRALPQPARLTEPAFFSPRRAPADAIPPGPTPRPAVEAGAPSLMRPASLSVEKTPLRRPNGRRSSAPHTVR